MNFLLKLKTTIDQLVKGKSLFVARQVVAHEQELKLIKKRFVTTPSVVITNKKESEIINDIKKETAYLNRDNISRTQAYLLFYLRNPEVHWSFLAHMVSRNGGYFMTDIKSSYLDDIIPENEHHDYFLFLERSNAYIFQDAYPQLLLYEYSKKNNKPLFHLLPRFYVSSFMIPLWEYFFEKRSSELITVAMIINEQKMLEKRILNGIFHSNSPLKKLPYQIQEKLGFTFVLFPFRRSTDKPVRLCGVIVHDFSDVNERILTGKKLYQILFRQNDIFKSSYSFAKEKEHTGSREDYWEWMFTSFSAHYPSKLYSPKLVEVWPPVHHRFNHKADWFHDKEIEVFNLLLDLPEVRDFDITMQVFKNYPLLDALDTVQHLFSK